MKNNIATSIAALGGMGEVGKNMYVITHNDEIIIIDAGVMFPEQDLLGIDYVIQDYTYLKENESKIKALVITHGHEDHIGGVPFLLNTLEIPTIYASKIAIDLINKKLSERRIKYNDFVEINEELQIDTKYFNVNFIATTHSIPDTFALLIKTPNGNIFETADFKFDLTPIGPMANIHGMAEAGTLGIDLLLSDSTNALTPGFSKSESSVDEALNDIIGKHLGRVIIATFASNIYRLKHIIETCKKHNRKILIFGRSMENNIELSLQNGLLTDRTMFINANEAKNVKKQELCILCTGSQGEPLAALSRIAKGTHKQISLIPDDLVVFSSSPIPGNSASVNEVVNKLYLKGVKVYTNSDISDVHTSGHAKQEELKLMLRIIKPKFFMPMHGEYRMLKAHSELAQTCDIPKENIFICENGNTIELLNGKVTRGKDVIAGDIYVDGKRIGEVGSSVLKERKLMSQDGVLATVISVDILSKRLLLKPNVTARGFVLVNENLDLMKKIEERLSSIIKDFLIKNDYSEDKLKNQIINDISPYIYKLTGRNPIILPIIMELK